MEEVYIKYGWELLVIGGYWLGLVFGYTLATFGRR